jgi:hypothetical protein
MKRSICASVPAVAVVLVAVSSIGAGVAQAATVTLTPVTTVTPNFAGPIVINGTVTLNANEGMYNPNVMSTHALPFLPPFVAGFNGSGQGFDPAFLAWNGLGGYSGPILNHQVSANNFGYAGGMPLGLYNFGLGINAANNPGIILHFYNLSGGSDVTASATYAINVVPTPGALALLGCGGLMAARRRR